MLAGEELPPAHLKHTDAKVSTWTEGGLNLESGVGQVGRTHLLRQEVNVLFVASLWGAVELHQSQGLALAGRHSSALTPSSFLSCVPQSA